MVNNKTAHQQSQQFSNLKNLKTTTLPNVAEFSATVKQAMQKLMEIEVAISKKQSVFYDIKLKNEQEEAAKQQAAAMLKEQSNSKIEKGEKVSQPVEVTPVVPVVEQQKQQETKIVDTKKIEQIVNKPTEELSKEITPSIMQDSIPQQKKMQSQEISKTSTEETSKNTVEIYDKAKETKVDKKFDAKKQNKETVEDKNTSIKTNNKTEKSNQKNPAQTQSTAQKSTNIDTATKKSTQNDVTPVQNAQTDSQPVVKTYTDEKGNIKIRRFVSDLSTVCFGRNSNTTKNQRNQTNQTTNTSQTGTKPPFNQFGRPKRDGANTYPQRNGATKDGNTAGTGSSSTSRPYTSSGSSDARYPRVSKPAFVPDFVAKNTQGKTFGNKNKTPEKTDDNKRKTENKKQLLMRTFADVDDDGETISTKRQRGKKVVVQQPTVIMVIDHAVISTKEVQIKVLSEKTGISVAQLIKALFKEGIVKTINDTLDFEIASFITESFNVKLEYKPEQTAEEQMIATFDTQDEQLADTEKRPPIVTVMGHVDHGKTSLLDAIRHTNVTAGEAGGITQHIGAYTVKVKGETITFIDTPGHAAFTSMRARGAKVTDVAIIVVAADDGVMPQTIEAINHAKAAEVAIIVAINKMDKPDANPDKVKQQLAEQGLVPEDWGGDTIMVPVVATKPTKNLDQLMEAILTVTEIKELKANSKKRASGSIIESRLDKGRGPVATILIKNGTLTVGDYVIAGMVSGKIRAMYDDKGQKVKSAGPSCPVEVLGFEDVPIAGEIMHAGDEKNIKEVASERKAQERENIINAGNANVTLGDLFSKISEGELKTLNIIIKTDVQGSLEALKISLEKLSNDEVKVASIHGGVGAINETDVMLARASNAIIIGFNVRPDSNAKAIAEREGVDVRLYRIIYDAVDDITKAMKGMLAPKFKEEILGQVTVRNVFKISGVGTVAGCYVNSGKVTRDSKVRLYRNNVLVTECDILALKRFKDDAKEVVAGYECGITLVNYSDIKVDDVYEVFRMQQIEQ